MRLGTHTNGYNDVREGNEEPLVQMDVFASAPGYASFRAQMSTRKGAYCSFLVTLSLVFFGTDDADCSEKRRRRE